jgi:hypothetical protein
MRKRPKTQEKMDKEYKLVEATNSNKYLNRCSTLLLRGMQNKTTLKSIFPLQIWQRSERLMTNYADEVKVKDTFSYTAAV